MARQILISLLIVAALLATIAAADRHVVELWSVNDVAHWVNHTVGYPEYSEHFVTHLVDGPTLLHMEVEDIEDTMPITNRIHIAKFKGHLAIVKDKCLCKKESSATDFWSHLRTHQTRSWILGTAAIFAPRAALLAAFFFDSPVYEYMTSVTVEGPYPASFTADGKPIATGINGASAANAAFGQTAQETSYLFTIAYWIVGMVFPSGYLLLNFIPFLGTNFVVVLIFSINFVVEQHREVFLMMSFLYGDFKQRSLKEMAMALFPLPTFFPIVGAILSLFAPLALLQLVVVALMIFSLFIGVGFVMMLFSAGEGAQEEAAARAEAEARAAASAGAQQQQQKASNDTTNTNTSSSNSHSGLD